MHCNLITDVANRVGLYTDTVLLRAFLLGRGHTAAVVHWRDQSTPADVNFFIEKFDARHLASAPKHVGVFNFEWFNPGWLNAVRQHMTQIWAKSSAAFELLIEGGCDQARFTGFLSRDPSHPTTRRERRALHLAGRSMAKHTAAVLKAYRDAQQHGWRLPLLTVVSHLPIEPVPDAVTVHHGDICQAFLDALLNRHIFHICPSESEGWGHYITEATACRGIVVTLDGSPMNEHVLPTFGHLIRPREIRRPGLVDRLLTDPDDIALALLGLNTLSDAELARKGDLARVWNLRRNGMFKDYATKLLAELAA